MLALIGLGVLVSVIMGLYLVQTFGKVLARLDTIEARLDALSESQLDESGSAGRLPPPDDNSGNYPID
ncbi:MAG: hypothetical protein OER85_00585 [Gammaproteobacteria bacterium]|nr:hypothetical protein [Gammaproteobacteria bacterium]